MHCSQVCLIWFFAMCAFAHSLRLSLPPELQEYVDDLHKICLDRGALQESDHQSYDINNKDEKIMCYMKCLMMESKWMKPGGEIDYDFIETQAHPDVKDVLVAALQKCKIIQEGADLCEKSYNFNKCLHAVDPVNWFFV
uniref:Odorant binding protein 9 n=1 Tax=Tomicus yunnanensis TaxID=768153 RepID=A0A4P2HMQ1_9CUCU|nr:odorant binding protein 9 [Tomicus yunnanensis]